MTKPLPFPEPLYERYRPRRVEDFIGLVKVKRVLEAFIKKPFDASFLFLGGSGLGKTTMGLAIADQIDAELHHVPSGECDLEKVAYIAHRCKLAAFNFETGRPRSRHLVLIDESDGMTIGGQRSLLSKLDSTACLRGTSFIFTANSTRNLEERFLTRCTLLEFKNEAVEGELAWHLRRVYKKEGGQHPLDFEAIAKASKYSVREALNRVQLELLLGNDRKGLPEEILQIVESHTHSCKKCGKPWKHQEPMCELPFRTVCPQCGGATSVGSLRAQKAHATMRAKAIAEHEAAKKNKKGRKAS